MADPLPISLVAHTVFCSRRAWIEAVGERVPSIAIEHGVSAHARVDSRADDRTARRRSVDVHSDDLGIVGRCDVVTAGDGGVEVVEFKSAPLRRSTVVTPAQRVQLALQRLCLEEMGHIVVGQSVYFTTSRKSVAVELTDADMVEARAFVDETRRIVDFGQAPDPLVKDPRCGRCSHASVCMPDEIAMRRDSRRIAVRDPIGQVLHLTVPGSRASIKAGRIVVGRGDEALGDVPLERVQSVVVHGNVDMSSALIRELMWQDKVLVWCSFGGKVVGYSRGALAPNGLARARQQNGLNDLAISRELVASKIANQATFLRRNSRDDADTHTRRLRAAARSAAEARSVGELFGIEGEAAATYFRSFPPILALEHGEFFTARWQGRQGRGAGDPLNVALNLAYGLLLADMVRSVLTAGLDPHIGFVHSSARNKPALALDLMEQFRPVVAESSVVTAINNGELRLGMFTDVFGGWRLRDSGRRAIIAAYERRVEGQFTHPLFGYKVSWRRAMEIQARQVLGVLDGSRERYVGIRVR